MLEDLIQELFDAITGLLDLYDICALRLASRQLALKSRAAFGAAAVGDVTTDFTMASLHIGHWGGKDVEGKLRCETSPYGDDGHWPRLEDGAVDPDSELAARFAAALARFQNCSATRITDE